VVGRRAAAALVVLALLAGCGDGDGDDGDRGGGELSAAASTTPATTGPEAATEAFVAGVCGAIATFAPQARAVTEAFRPGDDPATTLVALREGYERLGELHRALVAQVSAVPAPGIEGGEEVKAALLDVYRDTAATSTP
jgi:hypothetical protein